MTGLGGERDAPPGGAISGETERGEFGGGVGLSRESDLNDSGWDKSSAGSRAGNSPWGTRGADGTGKSSSMSYPLSFILSDKADVLLAEAAGRSDRSLDFVTSGSSIEPLRLETDRFSFS
jgi:hypothetical protein